MISLKRRPGAMLAAGVLALAVSGTASALPFFPSAGTTPGTKYEDTDVEWLDNRVGKSNIIDVGDVLISVAEFNTAVDVLAPVEPAVALDTAADEVVAVSRVKVKSINPLTGRIDFEPVDASTPMVEIYSKGSSIDLDLETYSTCSDLASCIAAVTDGNLLAQFTIADPDDEWFFFPYPAISIDPRNIDQVRDASQATVIGTFQFALTQVGGPFDFKPLSLDCDVYACAGDGLTDLMGNGTIYGGGGAGALPAGAFAVSDTDVFVIPEPAMLALMGAGLLGAGMARRRRRVC